MKIKRFVIYYENNPIGSAATYDRAVNYIKKTSRIPGRSQRKMIKKFHIFDSKQGLVWSL